MNASTIAPGTHHSCKPRGLDVRSRRSITLLWTLLLLGFLCARQVVAASATGTDFTELNLDELMQVKVPTVYGASKHEQKITEAPAAVSIVTQEDIKQLGYRTLADILRGVRDWYVTDDRAYNYAGVRGVNQPGDFGGRILLMIDGHRINDPIYDSSLLGQDFPLDVELIERVEVIRGPGSTLYGNNAFFGVVNVITRKGRDFQHGEVSSMAGDYHTYAGRFSLGHQFTNGLELLLSGSFFETDGQENLAYFDSTGVPLASNHQLDYESTAKFFTSISYGGFTLSGLYGQREGAIAPGTYGTDYNDPRSKITDERAYVELKYERMFPGDWTTRARAYYDHYSFDGNLAYDFADTNYPFITIYRNEAHAHFWGGEVQVSKKFGERNFVTLGLEGRDDAEVVQNDFNAAPAPPVTYIDLSTSAGSVGVYGEANVAVLTNLTLNAGVRYDYFTTFGSTVNPRAALIYNPWRDTTFKALYGHAYRAPNDYEFNFDSPNYAANQNLQPEKIRSYELVWEQGIGDHLRLTTTVFYNDIEDLIAQTISPIDGRSIFENTDSVDVRGASAELEGRWKYGLRGRISYTYAEAMVTGTDTRLNNSPEHLAKLQIITPLGTEKLTLGFELLAQSEVTGAFGNRIPGSVIGNLTFFSHDLFKNLDMSLGIYNLWDAEYDDPVGSDFTIIAAPQDGRSFRFKLTYRF